MAMTISELSPTHVNAAALDFPSPGTLIRNFGLSLNNVDIELSSLGASIVKVLLPNHAENSATAAAAAAAAPTQKRDDVVLSYTSPKEQYDDRNHPYFGSIVGRVANRIEGGKFELEQQQQQQQQQKDTISAQYETQIYQLEKNNGPNHLHGGSDGFCHRVWDAEVIDGNTVRFTLISGDGDQGYPGAVKVCAEYALVPTQDGKNGAKLCLSMRASLLPGETKATPISLAQHSYFNLSSHASRVGVLDHILHMPNCREFTPVNRSLIPTREVQRVEDAVYRNGSGTAMDFRSAKRLDEALVQYGMEVVGLDESTAKNYVNHRLRQHKDNGTLQDGGAKLDVARVPKVGGAHGSNLDGGEPYGFDHNYVIERECEQSSEENQLRLAAILHHPPTRRCLSVSTTAPGVQLYTSNYLDGSSPSPTICKEGTSYGQWQALCLETQSYPNSVFPGEYASIPDEEKPFANGRCFILRPGGNEYVHDVEYEFREIDDR